MQAEADLVLGEDPGLDGPDARLFGGGSQLVEEQQTEAAAGSGRGDVDRVLDHACVDAAVRDARGRRPPEDTAAQAEGASRCPGSLSASKASRDGGASSKVACLVAMPAA